MSNQLLKTERDEVIQLLRGGYSSREIERLTGVNVGTVGRYRRILLQVEDVKCPCGRKAFHRGWCSWRYERSLKRQLFMKDWHNKQHGEVNDNA